MVLSDSEVDKVSLCTVAPPCDEFKFSLSAVVYPGDVFRCCFSAVASQGGGGADGLDQDVEAVQVHSGEVTDLSP